MKALLIFLVFSGLANADADMIYKIKNVSVIMSFKDGILANRDCLEDKNKCHAIQMAKKHATTKTIKDIGGKNPNSVRCKDVLQGEVVIGTDEKGNENSFCVFPDHSMISCSSLNQF